MISNAIDRKWPEILAQLYLDHPDWNATQFRNQLVIVLGESRIPDKSAVQKRLHKMRENDGKDPGVDALWHLHDCMDMPAEAIGHILEVQGFAKRSSIEPLTIREAHWVRRLYAVKNLSSRKMLLLFAARSYAILEQLSGLTDHTFDTSELDDVLMQTEANDVRKGLMNYMAKYQLFKLREALKATDTEGDK